MLRTIIININPSTETRNLLFEMCEASSRIFVAAMRHIRQHLVSIGVKAHAATIADIPSQTSLWNSLKDDTALAADKSLLGVTQFQQLLRQAYKTWTTYIKTRKGCEKGDYVPNPPNAEPKNRDKIKGKLLFPVIYPGSKVKLDSEGIKLVKFKRRQKPIVKSGDYLSDLDGGKIKQVQIVPKQTGFFLHISHEIENPEPVASNPTRIAAIDPGMKNLVALTTNLDTRPILIRGGKLREINQFYHKRRNALQKVYDRQGIRTGNKMRSLEKKFHAKCRDFLHKASRKLISYCEDHNIDTIVWGTFKDRKQSPGKGKRFNQNWSTFQLATFRDYVRDKAREVGINFIPQNEGYTTKCSFLHEESIQRHDEYKGTRTGGRFQSDDGTLDFGVHVHSDVNGSANIGHLAFPQQFTVESVRVHSPIVRYVA